MKISAKARRFRLRVAPGSTVSALYREAPDAIALLVLAHGAGAGMTHPFMVAMADRLAEAGVSTLRFQFPYMEAGSGRPDRPAVAHAAIRAAVKRAAKLAPALPLFAGGKSFGGRMTSQAQALEPLPNVRGLVFLGFPLHPPEKPSADRAAHLSATGIPLLFIQGTRDGLARPALLRKVLKRLGKRATFRPVKDADHSFGVLVRSGRSPEEVLQEIAEIVAEWIRGRQSAESPAGRLSE
ncbi:alpha/beta family hydrolase [uncultured Reyranella sp.]|uniref:alpha/beta hydrolase family protein n=1 Tax=uncultured Reyranella sp. TaxID=735512 RepID=UPI0025D6DC9E|nr:alpha/beta family hydrolase [uncultured Reyranella sp.]